METSSSKVCERLSLPQDKAGLYLGRWLLLTLKPNPSQPLFDSFQPLRLPQPTNPSYFFPPLSVLLGMVILFRKRQTRLTGRFAVTFPSNRSDLQYSS